MASSIKWNMVLCYVLTCSILLPAQNCDSLNQLAMQYFEQGKYQEMLPVAQQAVTVCVDDSLGYISALSVLGNAFSNNNKLQEQLLVLKEAFELVQPYRKSHPRLYSEVANNLGMAYHESGLYLKALALYESALETNLLDTTIDARLQRGMMLWNLGDLQPQVGNDKEALESLEEAAQIFESEKHLHFHALSLQKLATFYNNAKLYEQALTYIQSSIDIILETVEENHYLIASKRYILAVILERMGRYEESVEQIQEARQIAVHNYGNTHLSYARYTQVLSNGYKHLKQYDKALKSAEEALALGKKIYGENHPLIGFWLNDLSSIYFELEQYNVVDSLMQIALDINLQYFGAQHPLRALVLKNYGSLCEKKGDFRKAYQYYQQSNEVLHNEIQHHFGIFNEKQREKFLAEVERDFYKYQRFALKAQATVPQVQEMVFDNALAQKGLLLQNAKRLLESLRLSKNSTVSNEVNRWLELKKLIATQYSLPQARWQYAVDSIEHLADSLEQRLAIQSPAFQQARIKINWKDVQYKLQPNEAAIEFISFPSDEKDSVIYCALVLRPGYEYPQMIYLFEEQSLSSHLEQNIYPTQRYLKEIYVPSLYRLIWQPIEKALSGVNTIYYSPAGLLHRIAFHALPIDSHRTLNDRYQLIYLSSTKKIVNKKTPIINKLSSAALFGGITYTPPKIPTDAQQFSFEHHSKDKNWYHIRNAQRNYSFDELPFSHIEIDSIFQLLRKEQIHIKKYQHYDAKEEQFKALGVGIHAPSIIHLATHGYFFGKDDIKSYEEADSTSRYWLQQSINPLLRSGLALSNANLAWKHAYNIPGTDDGILTAYEISTMDLSGTQLATLSACNTGLGDIKGSEGVYGLQRAFKLAGVDYILLSLWNISDGKETVEFMTTFYKMMLSTTSIREAFQQTQKAMQKKHQAIYYWAPFILIE